MFEAIAKLANTAAAYKLADLLLGKYFAPVLIVGAGLLAWQLTKMHNSETSKFTWSTVPGLVAAGITVGLFFLGAALLIF
ncbi:MAG: hypothetical protein OEZ59_04010 [Deltaproteobacteria bacterium]|nr:hypothetical protein [Deltaproteobacteria bacterium]